MEKEGRQDGEGPGQPAKDPGGLTYEKAGEFPAFSFAFRKD
jgi:hypothetical protein